MTDGVLTTEQRARRNYLCDWCGEPIPAGARYIRASLPPWTDPNYSEHWWSLRHHGHEYENCPYRIGHRCGVVCSETCIAVGRPPAAAAR